MEKAVTGLTSGFSQFEVRWSYFQAQNNRKTLIFSMVSEITQKLQWHLENGGKKNKTTFFCEETLLDFGDFLC